MVISKSDTVYDGGANHLKDVYAVDVIDTPGGVYAVVGGYDSGLSVYSVDTDSSSPTYGQLSDTPVDFVDDNGTLEISSVHSIDSIIIDGTTYVIAGGSDDGLSVFELSDTGQLTNTDNISDSGSLFLNDVEQISTISIDDGMGGQTHLVITAGLEDGLSVFEIDSNGDLTHVQSIADNGTLNIKDVYELDVVTVDDGFGGENSYVITADSYSDGLSVFEINSDGTLTNVDNVSDNGSMYLDAVVGIETAVIDGTGYVFTGGYEDGISIFEIDSDGSLVNVGNLGDTGGLNLRDIEDLYVTKYEGEWTLFTTGVDDAVEAFLISVDEITGAVTLTHEATIATGDSYAMDGVKDIIVQGDIYNDALNVLTVPCFVPGTRILTPDGPRLDEDLQVGDEVMTADNGPRGLRWIGKRRIDLRKEDAERHKPIEIKAGVLGIGQPENPLVLSPQHNLVLRDQKGHDTLVPAKSLVSHPGVRVKRGARKVEYYSLMLERHEILFAEGAPVESFYPGKKVVRDLPPKQRRGLYRAFPALVKGGADAYGPRVRPHLRVKQVERMLRKGWLARSPDLSPAVPGDLLQA